MLTNSKINELVEETRAYLEKRIELLKLSFIEESSENFGAIMSAFIIAGVAMIFLIFLNFFIAVSLGTLWDSLALGYAAVTGFYFIALLVLIIFRKSFLKEPLQNSLIKKIFKHHGKGK